MAKAYEVIEMLLPNGGYIMTGEEYQGIQFLECESITKEQFEAGFAQFDAWKAKQDATHAVSKAALLERLGITAEEATLLLG
jgi:hypothetical protein